jgi:ubiquinone/menaquinone biosynthesis C-methylase UbiE
VTPPQTFSVKRAEVEFHNFASLGDPEHALTVYAEENQRRAAVIRDHLSFFGPMTPFLEIGANVGHSSYLFCNDFGADGFALDISANSLRHGIALMDRWGLARAPVRIAGDAANLPFKDRSLRMVAAFQMLSQFMDVESVFLEVKRVLAPGGIFFFAEEPLRRLLTLNVYRASYYNRMRPWERKLYDWGLLGYLVRDVIGAEQEESFGIRQNHSMNLGDWDRLIRKHFVSHEYEIFVREHGWGERIVKRLATRVDPYRSPWRAARLLGGTLAAVCRKDGEPPELNFTIEQFENALRCPDCRSARLARDTTDVLRCSDCGYAASNEGGVYNLLPSAERAELYPGDRADIIDFSLPGHEKRLLEGWHELEGQFGGKYRWIGRRASARLSRVKAGPQRLRIRGHAHERALGSGEPVRIEAVVNGSRAGRIAVDRPGVFVFEVDLPDASEYLLEIKATPVWQAPPDTREFTVHLSMIRLVPRD